MKARHWRCNQLLNVNFPLYKGPKISKVESSVVSIRSLGSFISKLSCSGSVVFHFLAVEDSVLSNGGSETIRDELNYKVDQKDSRTDTASYEPLVNIETIITNLKHYSGELGNDDLETDNQEPDEEEDNVIS